MDHTHFCTDHLATLKYFFLKFMASPGLGNVFSISTRSSSLTIPIFKSIAAPIRFLSSNSLTISIAYSITSPNALERFGPFFCHTILFYSQACSSGRAMTYPLASPNVLNFFLASLNCTILIV